MAERTQDNPTLAQVISQAITFVLSNVHTSMPGRVESYDQSTGLANVQPTLKRKYASEDEATEMPIISNVPVVMQRSSNAIIKTPLLPGDYVLLVFSERGIDRWLQNGGVVDPLDSAMFALNDAVAIPGLYPNGEPPKPNAASTSVEISNGTAHVEVSQDGTVRMVADNATVEIDQAGNATVTGTKITLESTNVNLGDESGDFLLRASDLANIQATGVTTGGGVSGPLSAIVPPVGTTKTKAS